MKINFLKEEEEERTEKRSENLDQRTETKEPTGSFTTSQDNVALDGPAHLILSIGCSGRHVQMHCK